MTENNMPDWCKKQILDKRGAGYGVKGTRTPDLRMFECPECNKQRMVRPTDHKIDYSKREIELGGIIRMMYFDICEHCENKIKQRIRQDAIKKVKKAQSKLKDREELGDDVSLEDML